MKMNHYLLFDNFTTEMKQVLLVFMETEKDKSSSHF